MSGGGFGSGAWGGAPTVGGGGGGSGVNPPVITNFTPAAGSPINAFDSLAFDVTDDSGIASVAVSIAYDATGARETVYDAGGFSNNFVQGSSRSNIAGGFHFVIARRGGWPGLSPRVVVQVADLNGNATTVQ